MMNEKKNNSAKLKCKAERKLGTSEEEKRREKDETLD